MLAVDPSSPFSGGAILGDRVRMQRHSTDPSVFIRSMATRGHLGGLASRRRRPCVCSTLWARRGCVVETVGVGQVEVEIAGQADTTIVVVNPGWGDEVQAAKAGLLEIADIFVVNKADRPGADETVSDLAGMLDLSGRHGLASRRSCARSRPRARVSTSCGDAIGAHRAHPRVERRDRAARRRARLATSSAALVAEQLLERGRRDRVQGAAVRRVGRRRRGAHDAIRTPRSTRLLDDS